MKQFNANEHLACPACGFETVYIDAERKRIALVLADGTPDAETWERDTDAKPDDLGGIYCNHRDCGRRINTPPDDDSLASCRNAGNPRRRGKPQMI